MRASANRDGIRVVSDEGKATEGEPDEDEAGVFAKLPDSRPGARSPRRRTGARAAKAEPQVPKKAPAVTTPRAEREPERPKPPPAEQRSAEPAPEAEPSSGGGLEDVAWAGIAAAAEAATLGVRLASRAFESLRGNPGRR